MSDIEKIAAALKREKQRQNRLERNLTLQREQLRRADTRRKIKLGGLTIKAGLANESTAVILGLLLEAQETLNSELGQQYRERWYKRGNAAFSEDVKKDSS